jgi:hypothetical protein
MRFLVQNLDAIATLVAGIWATHVAWRRGGAAIPGMDATGWPERSIGPLLIVFAAVEFAVGVSARALYSAGAVRCGWRNRRTSVLATATAAITS